MPRPRLSRRTNPVAPRRETARLYRGVSPLEMADVLRTGRIVGRGNYFSGDPRSDLVFFGEGGVDEVALQAVDLLRVAQSDPGVLRRSEALAALEDAHTAKGLALEGRAPWDPAVRAHRRRGEVLARRRKRFVDSIYALAGRLEARFRDRHDGVVGFVLVLEGVPGGTRFTGEHSWHEGPEVGFPREPGVSARHLVAVHPLRTPDGGPPHVGPALGPEAVARLLGLRRPRAATR